MQRVKFANIHQTQVWFQVTVDRFQVADTEIEIHNAELLRPFIEIMEKISAHLMNPCKSILMETHRIKIGIWTLHLSSLHIRPPHQAHFIVKEKITLRFSRADEQSSLRTFTSTEEGIEIYITQDVNIVDEKAIDILRTDFYSHAPCGA